MKKDIFIKAILIISVAGVLFSGYLSYTEIFKKVCTLGGCSYVLGAPACVYGLVMYACVLVLASLALRSK